MTGPHNVQDGAQVSRRQFVKATGLGVTGASIATMLDARQAPAQTRGTTLRILQWSHFIPAYDTWFDKFAEAWGDKNDVKVRVDHIPHLELPARMAAEFAAGAGHDIIMNGSSILTRLYYKSLADLTDIYDAAGKKHGGWIPTAKTAGRGGGALLRHPALLHPAADDLPEGPLRRQQPEGAGHLGARPRGRPHAQAQGPPDGHPVLAVRGRQPQLAVGRCSASAAPSSIRRARTSCSTPRRRARRCASPRRCSTRA